MVEIVVSPLVELLTELVPGPRPPRRVNRNGTLGHINCHADVLLELANAEAVA